MRLLVTAMLFVTMACSTVVNRRHQPVPVATIPSAATVAVDCGGTAYFEAATPAVVPVDRSAMPCEIRASRTGHETAVVRMQRRIARAFWANLLWAGTMAIVAYAGDFESEYILTGASLTLFGMGVDASTGAMFVREPGDIEIVLPPLEGDASSH